MELKLSPVEVVLAKPLLKIFDAQQAHLRDCENDRAEERAKCQGCIKEKEAMSELKDLDPESYEQMKREGCYF